MAGESALSSGFGFADLFSGLGKSAMDFAFDKDNIGMLADGFGAYSDWNNANEKNKLARDMFNIQKDSYYDNKNKRKESSDAFNNAWSHYGDYTV